MINAKKASTTEAIVPAINELIKVLATRPEPTVNKKITPKFERQSQPDFTSGKLREFPMFKKDWLELVSDNCDPAHELRLIRKCVPESVQHVVTRLSSMTEVWEFLDEEFGKHSELTSERVDYLHAFQYSKGAVSESQKFMELYDRWTEVYSDLESIGKQDVLDHAPTIKGFVKLLPGKAIVERYIATNKELSAKGDSALAIVKAFMKSERANQKQIVELMGTEVSSKDPVEFKGHCFNCNQEGHKQVDCPNESSGEAMRSHITASKRDSGTVDAVHSLFQLQAIPFENRFVNRVSTFFDSGSNVNLVMESFA